MLGNTLLKSRKQKHQRGNCLYIALCRTGQSKLCSPQMLTAWELQVQCSYSWRQHDSGYSWRWAGKHHLQLVHQCDTRSDCWHGFMKKYRHEIDVVQVTWDVFSGVSFNHNFHWGRFVLTWDLPYWMHLMCLQNWRQREKLWRHPWRSMERHGLSPVSAWVIRIVLHSESMEGR